MANWVYTPARNAFIGKTSDFAGRLDLDTDAIYGTFNDEGTTAAVVTHVFLATNTTPNPTYATLTTGTHSLTAPTVGVVGAGVFSAASFTWTGTYALTGSTSQEDLLLFKDGGTAATSPLLFKFDAGGGVTGLPITPNGADVTVVWSGSGILQI